MVLPTEMNENVSAHSSNPVLHLDLLQISSTGNGRPQPEARIRSFAIHSDILTSVFVLLAHDPSRDESDWKWYSLAHICRQWRAVALDFGIFWSKIVWDSTNFKMIKLQLSRSKRADLSITLIQRRDSEDFSDILAAIFHQ